MPCLSNASAMSRLLVKEVLATCSLPLTFEGSALVKKTLSCVSGLLVGGLLMLACTNSVLIEELLAVGILFLVGACGLLNEECLVLIRPQIVDVPPPPKVMVTPLPSQRRGNEKGLNNLSNSSRPRGPSYKIGGGSRGEE